MLDPIVKTACELLDRGEKLAIASIVSRKGSTPRTAGTRMIVTEEGEITGTIGGGLLEAEVIKKAVQVISGKASTCFIPFDLSQEDAASMDMICGGKAVIFIERIGASDESLEIFHKWKQILDRRENGFFLTFVSGSENEIKGVSHCVIDARENILGTLPFSSDTLDSIIHKARNLRAMKILPFENGLAIVEPATKPKTAYFFGAGHVSQPTVHLASMTGFHTTVLDDREEFSNQDRFPDADEIIVLENFETAFDAISVDPDSFIVIFTRGHIHDRIVLARALKTDAGYIGMIGSKRKRDAIYTALMKKGFTQQDIERVYSPIGLAIGAQTPEEIAVSIVAEMIQIRAQK